GGDPGRAAAAPPRARAPPPLADPRAPLPADRPGRAVAGARSPPPRHRPRLPLRRRRGGADGALRPLASRRRGRSSDGGPAARGGVVTGHRALAVGGT